MQVRYAVEINIDKGVVTYGDDVIYDSSYHPMQLDEELIRILQERIAKLKQRKV